MSHQLISKYGIGQKAACQLVLETCSDLSHGSHDEVLSSNTGVYKIDAHVQCLSGCLGPDNLSLLFHRNLQHFVCVCVCLL